MLQTTRILMWKPNRFKTGILSSIAVKRNVTTFAKNVNVFQSSRIVDTQRNGFLKPVHLFPSQHATFFKEKTPPESDAKKGELVYVGTITNMVRNVKLFSLSTSIIGVCLQPVLYTKAVASTLPFWLKIFMSGFMNFFVFATPAMLHFITKRYVTHMYYNDKTGTFTATNFTFFVNDRTIEFKAEDVAVPDIPGVFATIRINDKPYFIDQSMFLNNDVYIKLMKFDQPIDWTFDDKIMEGIESEKKKTKSSES